MRKFWEGQPCVLYHIDRIESRYGNICIRGWVSDLDPKEQTVCSIVDANGETLPVYMERLVRADVNAAVHKPADYKSGIHILIDRAVLNTPDVWLTFTNGKKRQSVRIRVQTSGWRRSWRLFQAQRQMAQRIRETNKPEMAELDYDLWIRMKMPDARVRKAQSETVFSHSVLFSVVIPLYNTPQRFLKEVIDSVLQQTYQRLELVLADGSTDPAVGAFIKKHYAKDPRVRYVKLSENRGISHNTNEAIRRTKGDFIVFADHDDVLAVDALYEMARALEAQPELDAIYTDEDKINRSGTAYFGPHFKPDFSMALLRCNNYICHLFAARCALVKKVGLLDPAFDGAQDYDFVLRCAEQARQIGHIPKVLYHWRTHPASTAGNPASKEYAFAAGRRAVEAHYKRCGMAASVEETTMRGRYRSRFAVNGTPLVSILIPNKDHVEELERCLSSIWKKTTYSNYEILIIENNSTQPETEEYYERLLREHAGHLRILRYASGFNYAAIHNFAVPQANGEYLILLNNDTEVQTAGWIEELLGLCQQQEVGAVGAKLYYPDGTIQHAGVALGVCGVASHLFIGADGDKDGYAGRLVSVQDYSAVTAACMMTRKAVYEQVQGMEETLAVAYNDIDYCMKLQAAGWHVLFTPYAGLTHYESRTRGAEDTGEKQKRFRQEACRFVQRWEKQLSAGDPYYNPNLSVTKTDCSLRMPWEREAWRDLCGKAASKQR